MLGDNKGEEQPAPCKALSGFNSFQWPKVVIVLVVVYLFEKMNENCAGNPWRCCTHSGDWFRSECRKRTDALLQCYWQLTWCFERVPSVVLLRAGSWKGMECGARLHTVHSVAVEDIAVRRSWMEKGAPLSLCSVRGYTLSSVCVQVIVLHREDVAWQKRFWSDFNHLSFHRLVVAHCLICIVRNESQHQGSIAWGCKLSLQLTCMWVCYQFIRYRWVKLMQSNVTK